MSRLFSELAGGVVGTLLLTTLLRGASELGLTRMDLPFLLGTLVTDRRAKAKVIGYVFHFVIGLVFAVLYGAFFAAVGRNGWMLGAFLGILHAFAAGTLFVNVLLPLLHPRIGSDDTAADQVALLEAPGFLMLNYGRSTFAVTLISHIAYGAMVGWSFR